MIDFVCSGCGKSLQVKDEYAGKSTRCPACQTKIVVPDPASFAPPDLAPEPAPEPQPAPQSFRSEGADFRQEPTPQDADPTAPSPVMDFLVFRRMIVPFIIQVIFWGGVFLNTIFSFVVMVVGGRGEGGSGFFILLGFMMLFLGPIMWRVNCEILIVIFRINETLVDIKDELKRRPN